ncbi:MAG: acyl carrier protein [Jatrophihabitantaceae bacterium]
MHPGLDQVSGWLRARHPDAAEIDPDYDLIDNRLIDSMALLEFIILIERLAGRPIEVETIDIDDFRSLNQIQRAFFAAPEPT